MVIKPFSVVVVRTFSLFSFMKEGADMGWFTSLTVVTLATAHGAGSTDVLSTPASMTLISSNPSRSRERWFLRMEIGKRTSHLNLLSVTLYSICIYFQLNIKVHQIKDQSHRSESTLM